MIKVIAASLCLLCLVSCYSNTTKEQTQESEPASKSQRASVNNSSNSSVNSSLDSLSDESPVNRTSAPLKVITPDWGIAAELSAMGYPPIATGDNRVYEEWMGESLPPSTYDLGIRYQPNPEMMAQLKADLVVDNFFYEHIRPMYGDIPVKSVLLMSEVNNHAEEGRVDWQGYADKTLELGNTIGQASDAKAYIAKSEQALRVLGQEFNKKYPHIRKLAVVQFADVTNLRMYASNSFYQPTLDKMGLELTAFDKGNEWGFVNIQLGDLDKLGRRLGKYSSGNDKTSQAKLGDIQGAIQNDTCLIIVKPFSDMLQDELNNSALWQKMRFGKPGSTGRCIAITDPVWMYGGIASMTSFARKLVRADLYGGSITTHNHVNSNSTINSNSTASNDKVASKAQDQTGVKQ